MTIVPIRSIGSAGVNTDKNSLITAPEAFTMALNARFQDGMILRGPIYRIAGTLALNTTPAFMFGFQQQYSSAGQQLMLLGNSDGSLTLWVCTQPGQPSLETDITPSGTVRVPWEGPWTASVLNAVVYINRSDRVPWIVPMTGPAVAAKLPAWDPSWRCGAIRTFGAAVIAINVTKGALTYPTMIKTSDFSVYGAVPDTWVSSITNNATENILATLNEPLIDGLTLASRFMLYSNHQTWVMALSGDAEVYNYSQLFTDAGVISQNCVVEYNNLHYVFGYDDLWYTDGYSKVSIATGVVRNFIYNNLVIAQAYQFFAFLSILRNEIVFCYVSVDPYCTYPVNNGTIGYPGCNRAVAYNFHSKTFYFYDLPYVTGHSQGYAQGYQSWASQGTATWASDVGSWQDIAPNGSLCELTSTSSIGGIVAAVRSFEDVNSTFTSGPIDTAAVAPVYLENLYIDLDGLTQELRGYKVIKSIYPQAQFDAGAQPLTFSFGSTDYSNQPVPAYSAGMTFDGATLYKLDYMTSGRYLSMKITYSDSKDFVLTGLDLDFVITGHR